MAPPWLRFSLRTAVRFSRKTDFIEEASVLLRYTSDLFSYLGTLILWVFWPSFNAYAVFGDGRHRAIINTYISMTASTVMRFAH